MSNVCRRAQETNKELHQESLVPQMTSMTQWFQKVANWKGLSFIHMKSCSKLHSCSIGLIMLWMLVIANLWIICSGSTQKQVLLPRFSGSEDNYIDKNGIFVLSNGSVFGFGFVTTSASESTSYLLSVGQLASASVVWTANANSHVSRSDSFVFDKDGNAYRSLQAPLCRLPISQARVPLCSCWTPAIL